MINIDHPSFLGDFMGFPWVFMRFRMVFLILSFVETPRNHETGQHGQRGPRTWAWEGPTDLGGSRFQPRLEIESACSNNI